MALPSEEEEKKMGGKREMGSARPLKNKQYLMLMAGFIKALFD